MDLLAEICAALRLAGAAAPALWEDAVQSAARAYVARQRVRELREHVAAVRLHGAHHVHRTHGVRKTPGVAEIGKAHDGDDSH